MKRKMQAQQIRRPWLALLAAACLVLAIPAGRLASIRFAPAEDLLGYGGFAAAVSGIMIALLTGLVLGSLSLLRRESPRLLCVMILLAIATALAAVLIAIPG